MWWPSRWTAVLGGSLSGSAANHVLPPAARLRLPAGAEVLELWWGSSTDSPLALVGRPFLDAARQLGFSGERHRIATASQATARRLGLSGPAHAG